MSVSKNKKIKNNKVGCMNFDIVLKILFKILAFYIVVPRSDNHSGS